MPRHGREVVLISHSSGVPSRATRRPSGVARCRRSKAAWNSSDDGSMPWVSRTHSAITGSRARPWSVNRLPPNPPREPCSFSHAAERTAARDESFAASVAVMPWERARSHATRSLASATMRSSCACRTGGGGTRTTVAAPSRSKRAKGVSGTSSSVLAGAHTPRAHTRRDASACSVSVCSVSARGGSARDARRRRAPRGRRCPRATARGGWRAWPHRARPRSRRRRTARSRGVRWPAASSACRPPRGHPR